MHNKDVNKNFKFKKDEPAEEIKSSVTTQVTENTIKDTLCMEKFAVAKDNLQDNLLDKQIEPTMDAQIDPEASDVKINANHIVINNEDALASTISHGHIQTSGFAQVIGCAEYGSKISDVVEHMNEMDKNGMSIFNFDFSLLSPESKIEVVLYCNDWLTAIAKKADKENLPGIAGELHNVLASLGQSINKLKEISDNTIDYICKNDV